MWTEYSTNRWERRRAATRLVGDKTEDLTATDESHVKDPSNHCKGEAWNKRDALPVAAGSVLCHPGSPSPQPLHLRGGTDAHRLCAAPAGTGSSAAANRHERCISLQLVPKSRFMHCTYWNNTPFARL